MWSWTKAFRQSLWASIACMLASAAAGVAGPLPGHDSVVVSVSPAIVTLNAGQIQQLTATISGQSNQSVVWSLNPSLGTISSEGVYTAPSIINYSGVVAVTATSVTHPTATASAFISLNARTTVAINPLNVTLTASQAQQFVAFATGSQNPAVVWSRAPQVGSITTDGLYTAPPLISTSQTITVTATSVADTSISASAAVILSPGVGITLGPASATLGAGQVQQFVPNVIGTTNRAVAWTLDPPTGTITSNGIYTAPSTLDFPQSISITATSVADPTRFATALITLRPTVTVIPSDTCVPLGPSQTHQFTVSVTGTLDPSVTWSLNPMTGTISTTGIYTAPSLIPFGQVVEVVATSLSDPSRSAKSVVLLRNTDSSACHYVELTWSPSSSPGVTGYNLYRGKQQGGPYQRVNSALISGTNYIDVAITPNDIYYYVARSVDGSGNEGANSNEAGPVNVPSP